MKITIDSSGTKYYSEHKKAWKWLCDPLKVHRKVVNLEEGTEQLLVQVLKPYTTRPFWADRNALCNDGNINLLAKHGLDYVSITTTSVAIKDAIRFAESEADIEYRHYSEGFHYIGDIPCYMNDSVTGALAKDERLSKGKDDGSVRKHGSYKEWRDFVIKHIAKDPKLALALVLGASSAVVYMLRKEGVIEEVPLWCIVGESSSGKSNTLFLISSIWGCPRRLVHNFDTTEQAFFKMLEKFPGIPYLGDEATYTPSFDWDSLVYTLPAGTGRRRCKSDGDIREPVDFSTSVIITSEHSILDKCKGIEGQYVRMIELTLPWFEGNGELADAIKPFANEHHGWAGEALAKLLLSDGFVKKLCRKYRWFYSRRIARLGKAPNGYEARLSQRLALIEVTAWAFQKAIKVDLHCECVMLLLEDAVAKSLCELKSESQNSVYDLIVGEVVKHKTKFPMEAELKENSEVDIWGMRGYTGNSQCVWILKEKFQQIVAKQEKIGIRTACRQLHQQGALMYYYDKSNGNGRFAKEENIGGIKAVCYCLLLIKDVSTLQKIVSTPKDKFGRQDVLANLYNRKKLPYLKYKDELKLEFEEKPKLGIGFLRLTNQSTALVINQPLAKAIDLDKKLFVTFIKTEGLMVLHPSKLECESIEFKAKKIKGGYVVEDDRVGQLYEYMMNENLLYKNRTIFTDISIEPDVKGMVLINIRNEFGRETVPLNEEEPLTICDILDDKKANKSQIEKLLGKDDEGDDE